METPQRLLYSALVLHLLSTLCLLWFLRHEKHLSTTRHAWATRLLTVLCCGCVATSSAMMPHDFASLLREFAWAPRTLCISDGDLSLRTLHLAWSILLCLAWFTHAPRTRKLTLSASCRYVALRYVYSYDALMALCRAHGYAYFPLQDLEAYLERVRHGDDDDEGRAPTSQDIGHYITEVQRQEQALDTNDSEYSAALALARTTYEANRAPLVLARKSEATMTYEHYQAMKAQLRATE